MSDAELTELVQRNVEEALLGGPRRYTRTQVAEQSGVPEAESRRLWTALGFPATDDDQVDYTQIDITSVTNFRSMNVVAASDIRQQAAAARTIGQGMARLAEWQADLVLAEIKARAAAADPALPLDERVRAATESTMASIEQLQSYVWRRHLAAAVARSADATTGEDSTRTLAVGFADMVGFTRLTRHLHPDELSTLLEAFESTTTSAITDNGGWVIKNVGEHGVLLAHALPVHLHVDTLENGVRPGGQEAGRSRCGRSRLKPRTRTLRRCRMAKSRWPASASAAASAIRMLPGLATPVSRAAILTTEPYRSPKRCNTSP